MNKSNNKARYRIECPDGRVYFEAQRVKADQMAKARNGTVIDTKTGQTIQPFFDSKGPP
jgi:hypothetical protein